MSAPVTHSARGFTLIEMMVTIAIISIISGVILFNHQRFSDVVELGNETQNVALALRQVQLEGLAVRKFTPADSFQAGRGVYFDPDKPGEYILFGDNDNDMRFSEGEEIETRELRQGFEVDRLCAVKYASDGSVDVEDCVGDGAELNSAQSFQVSYTRPRPNADIIFTKKGVSKTDMIVGTSTGLGSGFDAARINIRSPQGRESFVEIKPSGEITASALF